MPQISKVHDYNGFTAKSTRLQLDALVAEATSTLTGFSLMIEESKHANGTQGIRRQIDEEFARVGGWTKIASGGIDWSKATVSGSSVGVEVQVSGRSDMLAVDIMHLKERLTDGGIDIGIMIVPILNRQNPKFSHGYQAR